MIKALSICYLIFFVVITVFSVQNDFEIQGYPKWMITSEVVIIPLGLISMLLYTFSYKSKFCMWLWKIVPFLLVSYYASEWYYDFIVYRNRVSPSGELIGVATVFGILLLLPLLYSSFKFGYSED